MCMKHRYCKSLKKHCERFQFWRPGSYSYTSNHVYAKSLKYAPPHVHVCYGKDVYYFENHL